MERKLTQDCSSDGKMDPSAGEGVHCLREVGSH